MKLTHYKWNKSGRTFKTEKPDQFVYNAFIAQTNIDIDNGNFAPYLYDSEKKIAYFADCELHLLSTGLRFKRNGKNFDITLHPETKKGMTWKRSQASVSDLSINGIHTEGPTDYLEVSYKLNTNNQESIVKVQVGGSHRAKLSFEVKAKVAGEQRLTLEHSFAQKPEQIYLKESLGSEKQYLAGYEFDFCHLFWRKDEVGDHKPEESLNTLKLHLKEGAYKKGEIKKLSPTDWGPNQIAANADDCNEEDDGTFHINGYHENKLMLTGSNYTVEYIGWRWDNVTASGTIDNASYLKIYNGGNNNAEDRIDWTLGGVEEADPSAWAADNKPSEKTPTTAAETGIGTLGDQTITGADFAGILQELVNTYTYSGSQALAMVMQRTAALSGDFWSACWDQSKGNNEYGELKIVYTAGGQTHALSASISGASGTATPDMNVLRAVLASISAGSAVPDDVILKLLKAMDASIASGTATPDTVSLEILRALAANIQAGSATPDDITLKLLRALTTSIQGASDTSAATLAVLRAVSATISAQSQTPDDVNLLIAGILTFSAAISAASASPDTVMLAVLREISSAVVAESGTTDEADLAVLRELSSSIQAGTTTPDDVALFLLKALTASIQPGTSTATVALGILREITSAIAAGSTTQSAILSVVRQISATVSPETLTSAITLIILGMGVITDATIESLTAKRTISSLTAEREFESLTPERTIEKT